jgi:hypothetical protein
MKKAFAINNKKKTKKLAPGRRNTFHIIQRTTPRWGGSLQTRQRPLFHRRGSIANAFCMGTSGRRSLQGVGRYSTRPQPINSRRTWTARKPHSRPGQPPRNASPTGMAFVPALPCLTSLEAFTPLGALTSPVGGVAALREHLPAPSNDSFLISFTIVYRG